MSSRLPATGHRPRFTTHRGRHCRLGALLVVPFVLLLLLVEIEPNPLTAQEVTAETVHRLVQQLGDPRRSQRIAAERELQALGPDILPLLADFNQPAAPAIQNGLQRVRSVLEREQAERSIQPSRVTLRGSFALSELVRQIEEQTQNSLRTTPLPPGTLQQRLSIDWQGRTFWECMDALDHRPELRVQFGNQDGILEIVPEGTAEGPPVATANIGAFRVTVQDITPRIDYTNPNRSIVRMNYNLAVEPRLRPLFVRVPHVDFQLSADDAVLVPLNKDARRERPVDRPGPVPLSIDFVAPKSQTFHQVNITGQLEVEVATGREMFVFRNLDSAEHVVRRRGGATVTLDRAELTSGKENGSSNVRVGLIVVYDQGGPAFESHRTWVYHNDAFLRSAEGPDRWAHAGFDTLAAEEAALKLTYRFKDVRSDPEHLEFVYVAPTLLLTVPVVIDLPGLAVGAAVEPAE